MDITEMVFLFKLLAGRSSLRKEYMKRVVFLRPPQFSYIPQVTVRYRISCSIPSVVDIEQLIRYLIKNKAVPTIYPLIVILFVGAVSCPQVPDPTSRTGSASINPFPVSRPSGFQLVKQSSEALTSPTRSTASQEAATRS